MDNIPIILTVLAGLVVSLTLVSVFSQPITAVMQRRYSFSVDHLDLFLLGVGTAIAVLTFGLMLIYLIWYF